MKRRTDYQTVALTLLPTAASTLPLAAQSTATPAPSPAATPAPEEEKEEVVVLSPFEVTTEENEGYSAATTLAGNRLNTELRDIGNAVSVITSQFLKDTGAVNNETLLQYTTGTEVGNLQGNFAGVGDSASLDESGRFTNPNQNTRVRGLTSADNTRDYFLTDIPWDGYNIDRVDLQRGPNSILFGQGSPAGLINSGTQSAGFKNSADLEFRVDDQGSFRASLNVNRELIDDELAFRFALLKDDQKYQQRPAHQDSERFFVAGRWEPGFLKKGSARTIVKFNYEDGSVRSNRPRTLPPNDLITPWFQTGTYEGRFDRSGNLIPGTDALGRTSVTKGATRVFNNLNKQTFNPHQAQNDNLYRSNWRHGLTRPAINGGPYVGYVNPYDDPWIGNFGQSFGGPLAYHADDGASPPMYFISEIRETYGINSSGGSDGGLGYDFNRQVGVNTYSSFARAAQLPFGEFGVYKDKSLSDDSVFNFYDNLLDGPNKKEWSDFNVVNVSLAQTFFNEKMGFELTYNYEDYDNGQLSLLSGQRQGIFIDFMSVYSDGMPAGTGTPPNNLPEQDGTPNPNLGRPFITDSGQFGNNSYESQRESARATAFISHDFEQGGEKGFLTRLLGRHTLTGLYAKDEQETDRRSWQRYAVLDPALRNFLNIQSAQFTDNAFAANHVIYLGPSLLNASSASGANIPRPKGVFTSTNGSARVFDSHWANRPGVSPSAQWINDAYLSATAEYGAGTTMADRRIGFQADNPANYVGWTNIPVNVTDSEAAAGNRDTLTTSASLRRPENTATAFVWQGHLWDNAIVGTYGWRRDEATGDQVSLNTNSSSSHNHGFLNLSPDNYSFDNPTNLHSEITEESNSWSLVAHISQFFGDSWPVRVSAFYSNSTNFQPEALRVDVYGEQIPLPSGETTDQGILLETKDGKYSLKINKYETTASFANSSGLGGAWFIGASQAWSGNWVNRFQYDITGGGNITMPYQTNNRPAGAPNPAGFSPTIRPGNPEFDATNSMYNYGTDVGETLAQAATRENAAIAAWRTWQASVDPRFYTAWNLDLNRPFQTTGANEISSSVPNGFALTEDSVSEGYEIELSAQPTRNWRLTLNAAKTNATRKNIGGANLAEFVDAYNTALTTTAAGDLRIWWGGAGNETALFQWNNTVYSEWTQRALQEDTDVPELREWRVNAITNYDFSEGKLKGFNVGGGLRWQDEIVLGYMPIAGATPGSVSFDIDNPYMGGTEMNLDLWLGYRRRFADKVDWRIQLNIRNLGDGDGLIPVTVQPDGSPAAYRIAPAQQLTLTNTFSF